MSVLPIEEQVKKVLREKYHITTPIDFETLPQRNEIPHNINIPHPQHNEHIKLPYRDIFTSHYEEVREAGTEEKRSIIAEKIAKEIVEIISKTPD